MPPPRMRSPWLAIQPFAGLVSMPIAISCLTARGVRPSPQTFSRGNSDFSQHDDVEAGLGEPVRRGRTARAGADDDDVGVVLGSDRSWSPARESVHMGRRAESRPVPDRDSAERRRPGCRSTASAARPAQPAGRGVHRDGAEQQLPPASTDGPAGAGTIRSASAAGRRPVADGLGEVLVGLAVARRPVAPAGAAAGRRRTGGRPAAAAAAARWSRGRRAGRRAG